MKNKLAFKLLKFLDYLVRIISKDHIVFCAPGEFMELTIDRGETYDTWEFSAKKPFGNRLNNGCCGVRYIK